MSITITFQADPNAADPRVYIRRASDNLYFNGTDWGAYADSRYIAATENASIPGEYSTAALSLGASEEFIVNAFDGTPGTGTRLAATTAIRTDSNGNISAGTSTADVWQYRDRTLTQPAVQLASMANGGVTVYRGDTITINITGLGDISGRSKLWFTAKRDLTDSDTEALIQIEETAGLIYIVGQAPSNSANGSITVTDASAGDISISLSADESAKLPVGSSYRYDVQVLESGGTVRTLTSGVFAVTGDATRATS